MTPYALWLVEFALSLAGAFLAWRRKLIILCAYLGFRALADIACFIALLHSYTAYNYADYVQRVIQYALFGILAVQVSAEVLSEDTVTQHFYAGVSFLAWLWAVIYFHFIIPLSAASLLRFESEAHLLFGAVLAVSMYQGAPGRPWKEIGQGLVIIGTSDAVLAIAQAHRWPVEPLYPLGAITGLLMLLWAVSRKEEPLPIGAVRLNLGVRTVSR